MRIMDSGYIDEHFLELIDIGGTAFIKVNGQFIQTVKMNPPCYFIKYDAKIESHAYPAHDITHTLIIAGQTDIGAQYFEDMKRKCPECYKELKHADHCGNTIQGFIITKDTMHIVGKIHPGYASCPNYPMDDKTFLTIRDDYINK